MIELYLEVDYLVKRLTAIKSNPILIYDPEYLNALYRVLPKVYQQHWDFFDKTGYPNTWAAFQAFLLEIYNTALEKRALMESVRSMPSKSSDSQLCRKCGGAGHKQRQCPSDPEVVKKITSFQVGVQSGNSVDSNVKVNVSKKSGSSSSQSMASQSNVSAAKENKPCPQCNVKSFILIRGMGWWILLLSGFLIVRISWENLLMKEPEFFRNIQRALSVLISHILKVIVLQS